MKVPGSQTTLGTLGKNAGDLVGENFKFTVDGANVKATGDVKNISDPWTKFSAKDNTGHFVPIQFPKVLKGETLQLEGTTTTKSIHVDDDLLLVLRLEGLKANVLTVKHNGELVCTIDFSGVNKQE